MGGWDLEALPCPETTLLFLTRIFLGAGMVFWLFNIMLLWEFGFAIRNYHNSHYVNIASVRFDTGANGTVEVVGVQCLFEALLVRLLASLLRFGRNVANSVW